MKRSLSITEAVLLGVMVLLVGVVALAVFTGAHWIIALICILALLALVLVLFRYSVDPDRLLARQSERTLRLAAQTLPHMRKGLNEESAQAVCRLLLPATLASSVAITNRESIMGFAGAEKQSHPIGSPIKTTATKKAIAEGRTQVVLSAAEIGFDRDYPLMKAVIVVPLTMRDETVGVLKFYYRSPKTIDATQQAMVQGLGDLLEMQLQLAELEYQRELATQMSLKALQAQINPHFLFNTINTIAALIRTNPSQARILLREFAVFYRRTLEGSLENITLEQELHQTLRYLGFEIARFGAERINLETDIDEHLSQMQVPAFIIQPLVENAIAHGMRDDRPLHISIVARVAHSGAVIEVSDDGVGMSEDTQAHMLDENLEHAGVAIRNVAERLEGFFGRGAGLTVQSQVGVGTRIILTLGFVQSSSV
ncbi:MAG: histidine kinase [Coriobacteriales bacterium]|jgi:two-component system sensor histidine kinase LytS|nr:histidine kinase [Coriobacteriales bacterium]